MKKNPQAAARPARKPAKAAKTAAPKAAPAPAAAPKAQPKRGLALAIFLLLAVVLVFQGWSLWHKDQRSKMVLTFVNQLAPNGRDQNGSFCCARDLFVAQDGNVFVLEEPEVGHRLQKFTPEGKFLAVYKPRAGKPDEVITQGYGLATDSKGDLYVLEMVSGKVKVLSPDLKFKRQFDVPTHNSTGLVINSKDQLIISDREKSELLVVSTSGELLRKMDGGKVRMGGPYRLALAPDDSIWVLDMPRGTNQDPDIKGYSAEGVPLAHWTVKDFPANPYNYIGYHPAGYIMINDNRGNSLARGFQFYTLKGKLLGTAQITNNRWDFKNISGFAVDPKRGDIYVNTNMVNRGGDRFSWDPKAVTAE